MELGGMGQFDTIDFTDEQDVQVPHPPSNLQQLCNVWVRGKFTRAAISVFIGFTILWPILLISLFVGYEKSCATSNIQEPSFSSSQYAGFQVTSSKAVVATDIPACSDIGKDVLEKGGNAVDATVASAFCLGILGPASSGIGGGTFILLYDSSSEKAAFIDGREVAPAAATKDMFSGQSSENGGLAIAVLGEIKAMHYAFKNYGSSVLSWSQLVAYSAELAEVVFSLRFVLFLDSSHHFSRTYIFTYQLLSYSHAQLWFFSRGLYLNISQVV